MSDEVELTPEKKREKEFNELHERLWSSISLADFPLPYREAINAEMRQVTLTMLSTIERIDVWRTEVQTDNKFKPDDGLIQFCKTLHFLSPAKEHQIGTIEWTVWRIADGMNHANFMDDDWKNIKILKESLARSQMTQGGESPYKVAWGTK